MVEVYTAPLNNQSQSTIGGSTARNYKRQRIKFNILISIRDPRLDPSY